MSGKTNTHLSKIALLLIKDELPDLIEEKDWEKERENISAHYEQLEMVQDNSDQLSELVINLQLSLYNHPKANKRFHEVVTKINVQKHFYRSLYDMASEYNLDSSKIQEVERSQSNRLAILNTKQPDKSLVLRINNIEFNLGEFGGLVAGTILGLKQIAAESDLLFSAMGVIAIASSVYQAVKSELSSDHALVLMAFTEIVDKSRVANLSAIHSVTNIERTRRKLESFSQEQVVDILKSLSEINIVERVADSDQWRIIEILVKI